MEHREESVCGGVPCYHVAAWREHVRLEAKRVAGCRAYKAARAARAMDRRYGSRGRAYAGI